MLKRLFDSLAPLQRRPLVCLTLLWAGGVWLATRLPFHWLGWVAAGILLLAVWFFAHAAAKPGGQLALGLAMLTLSAAYSGWRLAPPAPGDPGYLPSTLVHCSGYTREPATPSAASWHVPFHVAAWRDAGKWHLADVDILLSGRSDPPHTGVQYQIAGQVLPPEAPLDPFSFNWQGYLAQHGMRYRLSARQITSLESPAPVPAWSSLRTRCSRALERAMPDSLHAHLLESLVLGVYGSPLPAEVSDDFRRAGTIHLMVVSGSQVTLLAFLFFLPLAGRPAGWARTSYPHLRIVLLLLSLPVLAGYVTLADRGPSIDRALYIALLTALALVLALSPLARRRSFHPDGLTLLAAAGLLMLIGQPLLLFSPSLQLSFAAVIGLFTITPVLMRWWRRIPSPITLPIAATLGAQFMTYPVLAWHFGTIPVLAPLSNLIAVPIAGALLPLGLLTIVSALWIPPIAHLLQYASVPLLNLLLGVNRVIAGIPWSQSLYYTRSPLQVAVYFAVLALGLRLLARHIDTQSTGWDVPAGREPRLW